MLDFFSTPVMVGLNGLMIVYSLWVIYRDRNLDKQGMTLGIVLFAWLVILFGVFSTESVFPKEISGLAFYVVILAGVAVVGGLFAIPPLRALILNLDQRQLLLLQGVRVYFGAVFLIQGGLGILPSFFGTVDGISHITAGFLGLIAAYAWSNGNHRGWAWTANAFGLADILVVATSLAFVLLQEIGPHHPMMYAVFLAAPIWLWLHVVSIGKLLMPAPAPHPV